MWMGLPLSPCVPPSYASVCWLVARAIQASLESWRGGAGPSTPSEGAQEGPEEEESDLSEGGEELRRAVMLSRREEQERLQEEAQLAAILELSLLEK